MVHTFEITRTVQLSTARRLLSVYLEEEEIRELERNGKLFSQSNPLETPGVRQLQVKFVRPTEQHGGFAQIKLQIEPQVLLEEQQTVRVYSCSKEANKALQKALQRVLGRLMPHIDLSLQRWKLSRIDYAVNLTTPHVRRCVLLARKGSGIHRYEERDFTSGSLYCESKSACLNYYDKLQQLQQKEAELLQYYPHLLEEAQDIFRIELQCRERDKIRRVAAKYGTPGATSLFDMLNAEIAVRVLMADYGRTVGLENWYSFREAAKRIDASGHTAGRKEKLKNILRLVAQARKVDIAREQFANGVKLKNTDVVLKGCNATFNNHLRAIRELEINAVTIPREWKTDHIENPIRQLQRD